MAENKLTMDATFKHYDEEGWFICPLCPFDALIYGTINCPECGVKLNWDKNLLKIKEVEMRIKKNENI